jgi:hypothetical protein
MNNSLSSLPSHSADQSPDVTTAAVPMTSTSIDLSASSNRSDLVKTDEDAVKARKPGIKLPSEAILAKLKPPAGLTLLTNSNYNSWCERMEKHFRVARIWSLIVAKPRHTELELYADMVAQNLILQSISEPLVIKISKATSANEAWIKLKLAINGSSEIRAHNIRAELYSKKNLFSEGDNMEVFVNNFRDKVQTLSVLGEEIDERHLSSLLLNNIESRSWDSVTAGISQKGDISFDEVCSRLIGESLRRDGKYPKTGNHQAKVAKKRKFGNSKVVCSVCSKGGKNWKFYFSFNFGKAFQ